MTEIPFSEHLHEVVISDLISKGWTVTTTGRRYNQIDGKLCEVKPCLYCSDVANPEYEWAQFGEVVMQPETDKVRFRVREISIIHLRWVKAEQLSVASK